MTMQLSQISAGKFGKSKATLAEALRTQPVNVVFIEPTPFQDKVYTGVEFPPGKHAVVLDPMTRRRFCNVSKKPDGTFKVE